MSGLLRLILAVALWAWLPAAPAGAQELSALARVRTEGAVLRDTPGGGVELVLPLTVAVPYRVFTLDAPRRLVLDFNEVDWGGLDPEALAGGSGKVSALRFGVIRPGWSRMVLDLAAPLKVDTAALQTEPTGSATVLLRLVPATPEEYAARAGAPEGALFAPLEGAPAVRPRPLGQRPLVVVLDPGHGGIDPGAERGEVAEADLMLTFARELKEALLRAGGFEVVLTREGDEFVPLEARISIARAAGADVFLSLHADALVAGRATGATIYTLSERASDIASQKLAERHDRADLLAGVDLTRQDDVIAGVLMDLARTETAPRTDALADALVEGLASTIGVHKRPRLSAGFSVLKAPDIPSVLIELGFMSSPSDLTQLQDPQWRRRAAGGIVQALRSWAAEDAARARLRRR